MSVMWEQLVDELVDEQVGTGICFESRTMKRLLNTMSNCSDKGWKLLDPNEVEAGELCRLIEY